MINRQILKGIGLSENESEIYLIVLRLNEALASSIAKRSKVSRPHIYDTLNRLVEKGLISHVIKNNKKHFKAIDPDRLLEFVKEKEDNLKQIMPELKQLYKPELEKPNVEVFEGPEGLKHLLNDIIKVGKEAIAIGASDRVRQYVPDWFIERYLKLRKKKKIKARQLYADTTGVLKTKMSVFKKLPKEYVSPSTTVSYGDRVAMIIYSKVVTVIIIKDKEFTKSHKRHFDILWKSVK